MGEFVGSIEASRFKINFHVVTAPGI